MNAEMIITKALPEVVARLYGTLPSGRPCRCRLPERNLKGIIR